MIFQFSALVPKLKRKQNSFAAAGTNFYKDQQSYVSLTEQRVQQMRLEKQRFVVGSQTLSQSRLSRGYGRFREFLPAELGMLKKKNEGFSCGLKSCRKRP